MLRRSAEAHDLTLLDANVRRLTTNDLPTVAKFLPTGLGFVAYHAMIKIDENSCLDLFAHFLTNAEHNAQSRILKYLATRVDAPEFPRQKLHILIRQALQDRSIPTYHAILTLGCFDDPDDISLIRSSGSIDSDAVRWAGARLGDKACIAAVIERLAPPVLGTERYEHNAPWSSYMQELGRARWIRRRELIPVLISSLSLRESRLINSEFMYDSPSSVAISALMSVVPASEQPALRSDPDAWIQWWNEHKEPQPEARPDGSPAAGSPSGQP